MKERFSSEDGFVEWMTDGETAGTKLTITGEDDDGGSYEYIGPVKSGLPHGAGRVRCEQPDSLHTLPLPKSTCSGLAHVNKAVVATNFAHVLAAVQLTVWSCDLYNASVTFARTVEWMGMETKRYSSARRSSKANGTVT
jgi:hypothetical protein